jgi:hypothetical protein
MPAILKKLKKIKHFKVKKQYQITSRFGIIKNSIKLKSEYRKTPLLVPGVGRFSNAICFEMD